MSEKKGSKNNEEEEEKEGTLDADALDSAFDDHGFGDEDEVVPVVAVDPEHADKEDDDAEWNSYDDNKDW